MGLNIFTFTGNLGKDAEQKFTASNDSVVTMSVPVTSGFGDKQKTAWVRCTLWGKRGESVLQYLKKGQLVGISGEFSMNEWTDKDGQKRALPEVRINDLQLLGKASRSDSDSGGDSDQSAPKKSGGERSTTSGQKPSFDDLDDDIPF